MRTISKETIINSIKDGASKLKEKTQKIFNKTKEDISYIKESEQVTLLRVNEKFSKTIYVLLDSSNKVMYFKDIDLVQKASSIKLNDMIKTKDNKFYKVVKIDNNMCEYLLKNKKNYQTISCYKIYVKEAI